MARWIGVGIGLLALCLGGVAFAQSPEREVRKIEIMREGGGHLGVVVQEVGAEEVTRLKMTEERGALVKEVRPGSPAEKAGLKEGDVILRFQDEAVRSVSQFVRLVRETPPGRKVALEVNRSGAIQKLAATLEKGSGIEIPDLRDLPQWLDMPEHSVLRAPRDFAREHFVFGGVKLGIRYQEISGQLAQYFRLPQDEGVLVTEVDADSPAAKAGMRAGDVILKLNGKAIRDGGDLRGELRDLDPGTQATVTVQRDGKPLEMRVTLGGKDHKRESGVKS